MALSAALACRASSTWYGYWGSMFSLLFNILINPYALHEFVYELFIVFVQQICPFPIQLWYWPLQFRVLDLPLPFLRIWQTRPAHVRGNTRWPFFNLQWNVWMWINVWVSHRTIISIQFSIQYPDVYLAREDCVRNKNVYCTEITRAITNTIGPWNQTFPSIRYTSFLHHLRKWVYPSR